MTRDEFFEKYNLDGEYKNGYLILAVLDDLYLRYTKEQALQIMSDYYDNADEIYNSIRKSLELGIDNLKKLFDEKKDL